MGTDGTQAKYFPEVFDSEVFDDDFVGRVFAHLCVEDGRCDGQLTGTLFDGSQIPLPAAQDIVPNSPHSYTAQQTSINGGA